MRKADVAKISGVNEANTLQVSAEQAKIYNLHGKVTAKMLELATASKIAAI
jgi:hypothetical protein